MTVLGNVGKISWKVTIPIIILSIIVGVGIWFRPAYSCACGQRVFGYFLPLACSLSALILLLITLAWTVWGDDE